jgi:hypothetical protein
VAKTPEWRLKLWRDAREMKREYPSDLYRDVWDKEDSVSLAHAEFNDLLKESSNLVS